jgi:hypothetical protein
VRDESGGFQELRPAGAAAGLDGVPEGATLETPRAGRLELAPRTSGQILDAALEIARGRFGLYVLAASAIWVVVQALQPLVGIDAMQEWAQGGSFDGAMFVLGVVTWLKLTVQQLALVLVALLAWPALFGRRVTAWALVKRLLACLLPILFVTPVFLVLMYPVACCTVGVGVVYLGWKLTLVPCCFAIERAGLFGSFVRSFRLTGGGGMGWEAFSAFLRWAAIAMTAYVVNTLFSTLGEVAAMPEVRMQLVEGLGGAELVYDVLFVVLTSLMNGVGTALISVMLLTYYLDCRIRRDGLDLRGRLEGLRREWAPERAEAAS